MSVWFRHAFSMIGFKNPFLDHPASVQLTRLWLCEVLIHFLTRTLLPLHVFSPTIHVRGWRAWWWWAATTTGEGLPFREWAGIKKEQNWVLECPWGTEPHKPLDQLQTCGPSDLAPLLAQSYFESGTPLSEDAFSSIWAASSQTQPFFPQTCQKARMSSPEWI